ncbi:MAG: acyl carrier protein [Opitutales bacterium]|nr:acyl carrier protein [Opitutales bacterium]
MNTDLIDTLQSLRIAKGLPAAGGISADTRLRQDLALDSLDLAELTVRLEARFGVDVFADGLVHTVGEVQSRLDGK